MPLREPVDSGTLSAMLEFFSCPALIVERDRRVRAGNAALRACVAPEREIVGAHCYEVLHDRRRPCRSREQLCPLEACVRTGTVVPALHPHAPGMGEQILLSPIHADDGRVVACLATLPSAGAERRRASDGAGHDEVAVAPVAVQLAGLARSRVPLLIQGEPGTGRSRVARALHGLRASPGAFEERSGPDLDDGDLLALWARARPDGRVGTLHIREVHGLRFRAQGALVALLAAERGGRRRWRLISSTARDLRSLAAADLYRRDLVSSLTARRLCLPPLRERQTEMPGIVALLLKDIGGHVSGLTGAAMDRLRAHPFPGNLDELEQVLRHASFLAPTGTADVEHLPDWLGLKSGVSPPPGPATPPVSCSATPPGRAGPTPRGRRRRGSSGR